MAINVKILSEEDFFELKQLLLQIKTSLDELKYGEPAAKRIGKWLPESEAKKILGKSTTTLWKMRQQGLLEWTKIQNKVYYSTESIEQLMEQNKKEAYRLK